MTEAGSCYAVWDVSVDTLNGYRGRGLAVPCVAAIIHRMRATGREPVRGALATNTASLRLGAKLGFGPVDRLSPPPDAA